LLLLLLLWLQQEELPSVVQCLLLLLELQRPQRMAAILDQAVHCLVR
jgi:hypothetical protein